MSVTIEELEERKRLLQKKEHEVYNHLGVSGQAKLQSLGKKIDRVERKIKELREKEGGENND